jgi:hypothetical protein
MIWTETGVDNFLEVTESISEILDNRTDLGHIFLSETKLHMNRKTGMTIIMLHIILQVNLAHLYSNYLTPSSETYIVYVNLHYLHF